MDEKRSGDAVTIRTGGIWRWLPWLNALIWVFLSIMFFSGTGTVHKIMGCVTLGAAVIHVWLGLRIMVRPVITIDQGTLTWGPAVAGKRQSIRLTDLSGVVWQNKSLISFSTRSGGSYVLNLTQIGPAQRRRVREILRGHLSFEIPAV